MDFDIVQVANLLGLIDGKTDTNTESFNVICPCCGKRKLNITRRKNAWRCNSCGVNGGMLKMYVEFGYQKSYTKELGRRAIKDISQQLGIDSLKHNRKPQAYIDTCTKLSDKELNAVYSKLLEIPALALSDNHRKKLYKRGFNDTGIVSNQYRSLPEELWLPLGKDWSLKEFEKEGLLQIREQTPELKKIKVNHLIAGLYIGIYMSNYLHINLEGVPGFFKIKDLWCFRYTPGMLIPMRNIHGEIRGFQVRTDKGKLRYMTVSSKGFKNGTSGGAMIHFPRNNPEITSKTIVCLTEGPLKADAALSMTPSSNVAYMAIMGVNSTKELPKVLEMLKKKGCVVIQNALDMDKLTNSNVIKGVRNIKKIIQKANLQYKPMCWDKNSAVKILQQQEKLLKDNNIEIKYSTKDVFHRVLINTLKLAENNIKFPNEWLSSKTKGIDDYLLFRRNSKKDLK